MNWDASVTEIDEVTTQFKVSIPADKVADEFDAAIASLQKNAKIKGFRPGKAPKQMVEKLHGSRVQFEVANRLISSSLQDLVNEHKIRMVGDPDIDIASMENGKPIEYTANVSIYPEPKITGLDKVEVSVPKREVSEEDIETVLNNFAQSKAKVEPLSFRTKAEKGDIINAVIEVNVEGEKPSPAEPVDIALGEGALPEEVEAKIIGLECGSTTEVEIVVADDFPIEDMRGKKSHYKVSLNSLSQKVLPEINDEFAKSIEFGGETLLELRMNIRERLEQEMERQSDMDKERAIVDRLLEKNPFKVPQAIVDDEIRYLLVQNGFIDPQKTNVKEISMEPFREQLQPVAEQRVRSSILIDRIAKTEDIKAEESDFEKAVKEMAESNNITEEEVKKYLADKNRALNFAVEITRNKVLKYLSEKAKVSFETPKKEEKEPKKAKSKTKTKTKSKAKAKKTTKKAEDKPE